MKPVKKARIDDDKWSVADNFSIRDEFEECMPFKISEEENKVQQCAPSMIENDEEEFETEFQCFEDYKRMVSPLPALAQFSR